MCDVQEILHFLRFGHKIHFDQLVDLAGIRPVEEWEQLESWDPYCLQDPVGSQTGSSTKSSVGISKDQWQQQRIHLDSGIITPPVKNLYGIPLIGLNNPICYHLYWL